MTIERTALERRVGASLEAGRTPVLLGGCGMGRTTLLETLEGTRRSTSQFIDVAGVATTPELCLAAIGADSPFESLKSPVPSRGSAPSASTRAAFDQLLEGFDRASADGAPRLFLLDEFLEFRTFENFPGLRNVLADFITHVATSPSQFVLTSRFTARAHRLLRDAPARFEVIHMPMLEIGEIEAMARARDGRPDWARRIAPDVLALSAGRVSYAGALVDAMAGGALPEAESAMVDLWSASGRLTSLARFSYEFRLHRARGYGALKAILDIVADEEPLTLTDIAQRLRRTPGSTKDYLSWLEDVDVLQVHRKRYTFADPLVRLFVRLYASSRPPTPHKIVAEVRAFAERQTAAPAHDVAPPNSAPPESSPAPQEPALQPAKTGLIEFD